jgi:hypothetical protein
VNAAAAALALQTAEQRGDRLPLYVVAVLFAIAQGGE